jgi:hypothetical protein
MTAATLNVEEPKTTPGPQSKPYEHEFVLYRILGNDLPPRHGSGQTLKNLAFILEHEPELAGCQKRWVINRICDTAMERRIIEMISARGHPHIHIRFDPAEYAKQFLDATGMPRQFNPVQPRAKAIRPAGRIIAMDWIYRHKNLYAMNVNGARNAALAEGMRIAKWTLPFDGACFFTEAGWRQLVTAAGQSGDARYLMVPLVRVSDNELLLQKSFTPGEFEEHQIVFRHDARATFDERLRYGNRPKAELLRRLGVPGPWQNWRSSFWDEPLLPPLPEHGRFVVTAWVGRLASGAGPAVEAASQVRAGSRIQGVADFCKTLDRAGLTASFSKDAKTCYRGLGSAELGTHAAAALRSAAEHAMRAEIATVLSKTFAAPGVERQDYVSTAPYWHAAPDGGARRLDGERVAEAVPASPQSRMFDRSALETLVQSTVSLAIAGATLENRGHLEKAAAFSRAWFLDETTRMNPHIRFAQIVPSKPMEARPYGIVDFRGFWPLLDALRILEHRNALSTGEVRGVRGWFEEFFDYLVHSEQCRAASRAESNISVWHDLVVAAVAAYLGRVDELTDVLRNAPLRLAHHIGGFGVPEAEIRRANPLHYVLFNLAAWISLATLARSCGVDLWHFRGSHGCSLAVMVRFAAVNARLFSDYASAPERFDARIALAVASVPEDAADQVAVSDLRRTVTAHYDPDDGFPPLWPLVAAP